MATQIHLRNFQLISRQNKKDLDCVIKAITNLGNTKGNLLRITCDLRSMGIISQEKHKALIEIHHQNRNMSVAEYILKLSTMISFEDLCLILDRVGLNIVVTKLQETKFINVYQKPNKRELPYVKFIHKYYKNLKSHIDNSVFHGGTPGVRNFLRELFAKCDDIITSNHSTQSERQLALEKKAVALFLLMQQYNNPDKRKIIITQALNAETNGCDNMSLQIVCHSKLACTEILRGDNDSAKEYFKQTHTLSENISPCFAVMSALHDFSLVQRVFWSKEQSEGISETAMTGGENALLCMFEEQEEVQNMWKRIILQFMVMSLLKMKIDFKVQRDEITKENVAKAKELLHEIEKYSQGIETRRQMIKSMCYGVVFEMQGDLVSAQAYLKEAVDLARDGGCFHSKELQNIEEYHSHLSGQTSIK